MVKLKDIIKQRITDPSNSYVVDSNNQNSTTVVAKNIAQSLSTLGQQMTGIASDKQAEFSKQAATIVTSDEFLDELQTNIGKPAQNESEDVFVERAKDKMRSLLKSKLK